jgi:hypothetical protein
VRFDPERHHRRSIRRKGHDYRQGVYFVTITAAARQPLFGEVRNGVVWLSAAGALIADVWMHLPIHFPSVRLDAFVVMPDHFHGILVLGEVDWWESITGASRTPFVLTPPMRYPPFWEQMLAAEARARGVPECLLPAPTAIVAPPVGARSPRPEILNPEILNPEISNPEISNPEISNPEISNPEISKPEISKPEILNPEISNPEILNPEISNPETPNHENSPGNPLGSMHGAVGFTHGAVGFTHGAARRAPTAPLPNAPYGRGLRTLKSQAMKPHAMKIAQRILLVLRRARLVLRTVRLVLRTVRSVLRRARQPRPYPTKRAHASKTQRSDRSSPTSSTRPPSATTCPKRNQAQPSGTPTTTSDASPPATRSAPPEPTSSPIPPARGKIPP